MALTGHGRPINQVGAFYVPTVNPSTDDTTTVLRSPLLSDISRVSTTPPWIALGSANILLASAPVAAPFKQTDWAQTSLLPPPRKALEQAYNLNLYSSVAVTAPFYQTNWPNSVSAKPNSVSQQPNTLINLLAQPLIGPDLSVSKFQKPRAPDATQPTNINIFTNPIPFDQTDWSKTTFQAPRAPDQKAYNLPLYTVVVAGPVPFSQSDWSTTKFPAPRAPDASQSTSLNLLPDSIITVNDWSGSASTIKGRAPDPQPYNLSLYTVTVAAAPFSQADWSTTRFPAPRAPDQQAYNQSLYSVVVTVAPFFQKDWSTARFPASRAPTAPYNNALYTVVPFYQSDWPRTQRLPTAKVDGSVGFRIAANGINADLAVTEANDTLSATASVTVTASASLVEANDTLVASGSPAINAASALTEDADTLSASGVNGAQNTADLNVTEANDTLSAAGTVAPVVDTGGGGYRRWPRWHIKTKKELEEEELEELEELLRAAAEAAPKPIYQPVVYKGPLSAIFFEPIEKLETRRYDNAVKELIANAKADARRNDEEEALLMLLLS